MQAPTFPMPIAWNAKETIYAKVGVGSEIVDFTSCPPAWSMTSIIAPCETLGNIAHRIFSASSHAELNAEPIAQELPLFARSARALGQT